MTAGSHSEMRTPRQKAFAVAHIFRADSWVSSFANMAVFSITMQILHYKKHVFFHFIFFFILPDVEDH